MVGALVLMNLEGEDERNLFGLVFEFVGEELWKGGVL
jgi:hypothetical protein